MRRNMTFHFFKNGNCWRFWKFPHRCFYWGGKLTYWHWWRFAVSFDHRKNWLADMIRGQSVDITTPRPRVFRADPVIAVGDARGRGLFNRPLLQLGAPDRFW